MEVQHLSVITDFYYTLLVSILLHKKYSTTRTSAECKKHIATWLNETKKNKVFDKIVLKEISWLQEELPKRSADQLEMMLTKIYQACIELQTDGKT